MNPKIEGTIEILAAMIVLYSAKWDPRISVAVAAVALVALGVYKLTQKQKIGH
jgi:hypothetical protein